MDNEFKIITIENDDSFVTIDTLVRFSGNGEKPIKALIRKYIDKIEAKSCAFSKSSDSFKFPRLSDGANKNSLDWGSITLNERQAMFLLTLMGNSEKVVNFKDNLETEFYKYKNQEVKVLTPLQHMEIANKMLLEEDAKKTKEIAFKAKLLQGQDTVIKNIADDLDDEEVDMTVYCQLLTSRATDTYLGRTTVYKLLRLMKLVRLKDTTPTQLGSATFLKLRHHENGISTKVLRSTMPQLTKKLIKYLLNNDDVNESLGYPFHPELRE